MYAFHILVCIVVLRPLTVNNRLLFILLYYTKFSSLPILCTKIIVRSRYLYCFRDYYFSCAILKLKRKRMSIGVSMISECLTLTIRKCAKHCLYKQFNLY